MPQPICAYTLPNNPESVGRARAWVRIMLTAAGREDLIDSALLIMSELATNTAVHATQSDMIKIVCEVDGDTLTLGVIDYDERQPILLTVREDDERGRGLKIVDALCDEWGCSPCDGGKIVFGLLHLHAHALQPSAIRPHPQPHAFA